MTDRTIFSLVGVAFAAVAGITIWATISSMHECKARGGHFVSKQGAGVGIGSQGNVVPTFTTTSFCLSADGRILE